jgi:Na+(H+)/acetate symporter ActP
VIVLAIFWPRLTTLGAAAGMLTGLIGSILLIYLSPLVQVDILQRVWLYCTCEWRPQFATLVPLYVVLLHRSVLVSQTPQRIGESSNRDREEVRPTSSAAGRRPQEASPTQIKGSLPHRFDLEA